MKKLRYFSILLVTLWIVIILSSCETKNPTNPNPIPEDTMIVDCLDNEQYDTVNRVQGSYYIVDLHAISQDKNIMLTSRTYPGFIDIKKSEFSTNYQRFWDAKRNDWCSFSNSARYSECLYDNNQFVGLLHNILSDGTTNSFFSKFNIQTNSIEEIEINVNGESIRKLYQGIQILRWLPKSKPGDDYLFLSNNTIYHVQRRTFSPGVTSVNLTSSNPSIFSVSPDGKYIYHKQGGKPFINNEEFTYDEPALGRINWSNDSKYFVYQANGYNGHMFLEVCEVLPNGTIQKVNSIDLTKRFCSFGPCAFACFMSDNTLGVYFYKNNAMQGNIYEVNFKGKILRQLSYFQ
jgi:hypothetical protein